MSSVPKSRRYTTEAKFITELKALKALTIRKCLKFPKRYNATITDQLIRSVTAAKHFALKANSIFPPATKRDAETRRNCFLEACAELEAFGGDIDDLTEMGDIFHLSVEDLEEWSKQAYLIISIIQHVMSSDEKRFSDLP